MEAPELVLPGYISMGVPAHNSWWSHMYLKNNYSHGTCQIGKTEIISIIQYDMTIQFVSHENHKTTIHEHTIFRDILNIFLRDRF